MKAVVIALVGVLLLGAVSCKKKETEVSVSDFKPNFNMAPRTASSAAETAPPVPVLVATTAKIGPAGGTLNSSDGKLSLSIPAGALATETEVRIQPTEDATGESFGPVYELSPEGTTFPQPITLAWHLSEADLARTNLDNLVVRTKESNGNWQIQSNVKWNEADRTIRTSAKHFSKWDLALTLRLQPSQAKVFIGDSLELTAYVGTTKLSPPAPDQNQGDDELLATPAKPSGAASQSQSDPDDALVAAPPGDVKHHIFRDAVWRVNGEHCGNFKLGVINQHYIGHFNVDDAAYQSVEYVTPDNVPAPNPVTVSFEITVKLLVTGKTGPQTYTDKKMIATALITVLPREDHWVGYSNITQGGGDKVSSQFTFAKVPNDQNGPILNYQILNGTVGYKGPKTVSGGACTLSIWPSSYFLTARPDTPREHWSFYTGDPRQHIVSGQGGSDGRLVVDMSNPNQWLVSGQGESVWLATYTTHCPNGDGSMPMGVHAGWWPIDPSNMGTPTPVAVTPGKPPDVYVKIDGPMGTGTVHLNYMGYKPDSIMDRTRNFYCQ